MPMKRSQAHGAHRVAPWASTSYKGDSQMVLNSVRVENVQAIRTVHVKPDRHFNIVTGVNGQGKTSLIRAIQFALAGKRSHSKKPIREGEEEGVVVLEVGDWRIELELEQGSAPRLTLTRMETGERAARPQETLNKWLGELSFDPLAFSRMAPAQQRKVLLEVVDLGGFDLERNQKEHDKTFELRQAVNRTKRDIEGDIAENYPPGESFADLPDEKVKIAEAVAELQHANDIERANDETRAKHTDALSWNEGACSEVDRHMCALATAKAEVKACEECLEVARRVRAGSAADVVKARALVDAIEEPDIDAFERRVSDVEEINVRIDERERRTEAVAHLARTTLESEHFDAHLDTLKALEKAALSNAKWPIDGLGVKKDTVIFQGRPLGQACASEQLATSVAIAMALNPTLCIMFIEDGSLLDDERMATLKGLAEANDFQLWVERVSKEPQQGSIHIHAGSVVTEDGPVGAPEEAGIAQHLGVTIDGE